MGWWSVGRDEAERAGLAGGLAGVVRVVEAVGDGHCGEVEGADALEAGDIDGVEGLVGAALVVGVDAAAGTEEMLRRPGVEAIAGERVLTLEDGDPPHGRHGHHSAAHPAVGAGATADGVEPVGEGDLEADCAAVALGGVGGWGWHGRILEKIGKVGYG
jgi:hypothetical protein